MSAVSSVLRNSAVLLSGTIGSKLLVLFSYAVLTRTLGPAGFGRYSLVFAWIAFFEVFTDAGLDSLTAREAARDRESTGQRVGDALILRFLLAAITIPVAAWAFRVFTPEATFPLAALAGLVLLTSARRASLRSALEVPFRIDLAMGIPTLLAVLAEAVHLGLVAGPLRRLGVEGAVAAQSLSPLPFLVLLAIASHRRAAIRLRPDPARLGALARTSLPFVAVLIVNVVLARVDVLMLEYLRDSHEVGVYAAPTRVVEVANLLAILLMTSVFPLFAERRGEEARVERLFRESLRVLVAVVVPVVAVQIAFAGPLVRMLFGRDWSASADVLPWLALSEVLVYADIVITARLLATGRERLNLGLLACAAGANVALNLVLIPPLGARGAAIATLIAYAIRILAGFGPRAARPLTRQTLASLGPAVLAGAVAFAPTMVGGTWRAVAFAAGAVGYPALLWILGGVRLSDFRELRDAIRPPAAPENDTPGADDVGGPGAGA